MSEKSNQQSSSAALTDFSGKSNNINFPLDTELTLKVPINSDMTSVDTQIYVDQQPNAFALARDNNQTNSASISHCDVTQSSNDVTNEQRWVFNLDRSLLKKPQKLPHHLMFAKDSNTKLLFLVDTGCEISILPKSFIDKVEKPFSSQSRIIQGMNKMKIYPIGSSTFELQLGNLPLIKHDFWVIEEPILYGILGINFFKSNRLILNPAECSLTSETNGLAKLLTGRELSKSNMKFAKISTHPVEPKIIEITSDELVEPSIVRKSPAPVVKSVNMASTEIHDINSELGNQRFEKPCLYLKRADIFDSNSPSKYKYTSSILLNNENSHTIKAFKNIRHLKRYQQRNIVYNEPVNKLNQRYKFAQN